MHRKRLSFLSPVFVSAVLLPAACGSMAQGEPGAGPSPQEQYARALVKEARLDGVAFKLIAELNHPEAFRIRQASGGTLVEAASPAGWIYGAAALAEREAQPGVLESPAFDLRGTTLWLGGAVAGGRIAPYHSGFDAKRLPWFFDRPFMTRYLDSLVLARYNTLFLWASHPFPSLLELPEYPGATNLTPEQLRQNQEQFRWFASECARRVSPGTAAGPGGAEGRARGVPPATARLVAVPGWPDGRPAAREPEEEVMKPFTLIALVSAAMAAWTAGCVARSATIRGLQEGLNSY